MCTFITMSNLFQITVVSGLEDICLGDGCQFLKILILDASLTFKYQPWSIVQYLFKLDSVL